MFFPFICILAIGSSVLFHFLLALRRSHLQDLQEHQNASSNEWKRPQIQGQRTKDRQAQASPPPWIIQLFGLFTAFSIFTIPLAYRGANVEAHCFIRAICFFYACKTLDLAIARLHQPPVKFATRPSGIREPVPLKTAADKWLYTWSLMSEMRYHSFDIAVHQKGRGADGSRLAMVAWTLGPYLILPTIAYTIPTPYTKVLVLLLLIEFALEAVHTIFHPHCPHRLFYRPWGASSISDFWSTRWHACAAPFLHTLAFEPAQRFVTPRHGKEAGKAAGVLAAFCLSGIWHAWCGAPLSTSPWLTLQMWIVFMAMGVGCLLERKIWGARQGRMLQRICVWVYVVAIAGWCWDTLERTSTIPWLKVGI